MGIGQDTIYGKVTVDIPDDAYDGFAIMEVLVENVYVCTADDDLSSTLDSDSGIGGCFSSSIDPDGPYIVVGRRRMLVQSGDSEGNQFKSYLGTASVQEAET